MTCFCQNTSLVVPSPIIQTIHVVIAFCKIQVDLRPLKHILTQYVSSIYVLSKCGQRLHMSYNYTNIVLPNTGRVDHSYLMYIEHQYHRLPDAVIFIKDSWNLHPLGPLTHPDKLVRNVQRYGFACGIKYPIWHDIRRMKRFYIRFYEKLHDQNPNNGVNFTIHSNYGQWMRNIGFEKVTTLVPVCYGGVFAISRDNIVNVRLQRISKIRSSLERGDNILESHFMERTWMWLFTKRHDKQKDRRLIQTTKRMSVPEQFTGMRQCRCGPHS